MAHDTLFQSMLVGSVVGILVGCITATVTLLMSRRE